MKRAPATPCASHSTPALAPPRLRGLTFPCHSTGSAWGGGGERKHQSAYNSTFFSIFNKTPKKYHNPPKIDASPTPIIKLVPCWLPSTPHPAHRLVPRCDLPPQPAAPLPAPLQVLPDTPLGGPHPRGGSVRPRIGEQRKVEHSIQNQGRYFSWARPLSSPSRSRRLESQPAMGPSVPRHCHQYQLCELVYECTCV